MEETNLILFPDLEKLKTEVGRMKAELSMLLLEHDELQFVVCKNLETEYMLKLGGLEYRTYEAQCRYLRLKRKAELIQAKINRQETIYLPAIEEKLDAEFAEYQKQLNAQIGRMNEALKRSRLKTLTGEETAELKKLYHRIVKALHPDLHPGVTKEQQMLFEHAVYAYKNGDLPSLRLIGEMVGDTPDMTQEDAAAALGREKERLSGEISEVRSRIDQIKGRYPYTMKSLLKDETKLAKKRQELEELLEQYRQLAAVYETRIEEMRRGAQWET